MEKRICYLFFIQFQTEIAEQVQLCKNRQVFWSAFALKTTYLFFTDFYTKHRSIAISPETKAIFHSRHAHNVNNLYYFFL